MSLKPWREIATPHKDILAGTFRQPEFAADISQVVKGVALAEYKNLGRFFFSGYNEISTAWYAIVAASHEVGHKGESLELDL
jgi:hypothetical protein